MSTSSNQFELFIGSSLIGKGNYTQLFDLIRDAASQGKEVRLVPVKKRPPQPPKRTMRYVATVHLVLPEEIRNENRADEAISEMLTNNLESNGAIDDWGYTKIGGQFLRPSKQMVKDARHPDFEDDVNFSMFDY